MIASCDMIEVLLCRPQDAVDKVIEAKANHMIDNKWAAQRSLKDTLRGSSAKLGTIQRRLAWPLRKGGTHKSRSANKSAAQRALWPPPSAASVNARPTSKLSAIIRS